MRVISGQRRNIYIGFPSPVGVRVPGAVDARGPSGADALQHVETRSSFNSLCPWDVQRNHRTRAGQ